MPESRRRKSRKNPNRPASNPRQSLPRQAERKEMNGNDGKTEISILSSRQQGALPVIAVAPTVAQAARDCRLSESTIRRWLRDPAFAEELDLLRREYADQISQQSLGLLLRGMNVLAESMEDPDPNLRLRATRYAMSFAVHLQGSMKLDADIREMRESLDSALSGNYFSHPDSDQPEPEEE